MKKLFFTVVAIVAFSAGSMANTIEVKEQVQIADSSAGACIDDWMGNYNHLRAAGCSDATSISQANRMMEACERDAKTSSPTSAQIE